METKPADVFSVTCRITGVVGRRHSEMTLAGYCRPTLCRTDQGGQSRWDGHSRWGHGTVHVEQALRVKLGNSPGGMDTQGGVE